MNQNNLVIGGLTPMSCTDMPGEMAAVIFLQGCPWRCSYCQNEHLLGNTSQGLSWQNAMSFLHRRKGLLDAVVFSGGEPTLQHSLPDAVTDVKSIGFKVGLHTGGAYPDLFRRVLPAVDWVGFDVKAEFSAYEAITGVPKSGQKAQESLMALLERGGAYEVRTTVHPSLHSTSGIYALGRELAGLGVRRWALQKFRATGCSNVALTSDRSPSVITDALTAEMQNLFESFEIREA